MLFWYEYILLLLAGLGAGIINTVAGSGSVITLSVLVFMGLPADVANGTNRIGVIFQSAVGFFKYKKAQTEPISTKTQVFLLIPSILGAMLGAYIAAVQLDELLLRRAIGVLMIFLLIPILFNPKAWISQKSGKAVIQHPVLVFLMLFLIGLYAGFIQAGVGVLMLVGFVVGLGYSLPLANSLKLLLVLVFTLPVLGIFIWKEQVRWDVGLILSVGQVIGAVIGANFATRHPKANVWIRYLLIVLVMVAIVKFLFF